LDLVLAFIDILIKIKAKSFSVEGVHFGVVLNEKYSAFQEEIFYHLYANKSMNLSGDEKETVVKREDVELSEVCAKIA
jgi:hypothetical protein